MWQLVWQVCRAACFEEIPHCPCVVSALLMRLLLMCFSAVSSNKIRRVCAASRTFMEVLQQAVCKKPDIQGPQEGSSNHTASAEPLITLWFLWLSSGPLASNHLPTTSLLNGYFFPAPMVGTVKQLGQRRRHFPHRCLLNSCDWKESLKHVSELQLQLWPLILKLNTVSFFLLEFIYLSASVRKS